MNKITNVLGIALIIAAGASPYLIEGMFWGSALLGVGAGAGLIYIKNNRAAKLLERIVDIVVNKTK